MVSTMCMVMELTSLGALRSPHACDESGAERSKFEVSFLSRGERVMRSRRQARDRVREPAQRE